MTISCDTIVPLFDTYEQLERERERVVCLNNSFICLYLCVISYIRDSYESIILTLNSYILTPIFLAYLGIDKRCQVVYLCRRGDKYYFLFEI